MCVVTWLSWGVEELKPSVPLAQPRLAWAVPVSMDKLGASIEALSNTMPQVLTLQLCHRFGKSPLSKLPQEIVELIADEVRRVARSAVAAKWYHNFMCFQNRCEPYDHYYSEDGLDEKYQEAVGFFQRVFAAGDDPDFDLDLGENPSVEKKKEVVQMYFAETSQDIDYVDYQSHHFRARCAWLDQTCLCLPGRGFTDLNELLRSRFGLEVVIQHEMVEAELDRFLTSGEFIFDERMYYTLCYLTLTPQGGMEYIVGGRTVPEKDKDSNRSGRHKSFQQVIDYPLLAVSENQRLRFKKAMRVLDISPHYHLSELEPCVGHPFKDKVLADLCRCARTSCPAPYTVREDFEAYTKEKNKELAKESWPKLMLLAASDLLSMD